MAIGPTVGGLLVDAFGWRSLFIAILPVAAATLVLALIGVPKSSDPRGRGLDLPGQVLAVMCLGALCLGVIEGPAWGWHSPVVLVCLTAAVAAGAGFLRREHRAPSPLVPLEVFRNRPFSAAVADAGLMTFGMYGLLFVLPLYFQAVRNETAARAGIELLPMSVSFFLVSLLAGRVATRVGPRALIGGGMALVGLGMLLLAAISADSPFMTIAVALLAVGIGLGLITGPIATAAVANAPAARSGMSSGLVNVGRMIGATLGVGVLGLLFGGRVSQATGDADRFMAGLHAAFLLGAAALLCGALIALVWFRRDSLETVEPGGSPA